MIRKKTSSLGSKKVLLGILAVIFIAAAGWLLYGRLNARNSTPAPSPNLEGVNLQPATEEEKQESNQLKEESANRESQQTNPGARSVTPIIVDAGQYNQQIEVRAYVPGVVETGGTCTITFTNGSAKVTKTMAGASDATTTRCANLVLNQSELSPKGTWTVVVSYTSSVAQGSSQAKTFELK